jgi:hypothetical protein
MTEHRRLWSIWCPTTLVTKFHEVLAVILKGVIKGFRTGLATCRFLYIASIGSAPSISLYGPNVVFNFVNVCKVSKVNVKYVTYVRAKRDDQNSAIVRVCFTRVYVFTSAATFNTVFYFFLANQTSFEDEFRPTASFIDDQFFDVKLKWFDILKKHVKITFLRLG